MYIYIYTRRIFAYINPVERYIYLDTFYYKILQGVLFNDILLRVLKIIKRESKNTIYKKLSQSDHTSFSSSSSPFFRNKSWNLLN